MRIIVIGAGVIGATSAHWLAAAGHKVVILEQAAGPAQGVSAGNGGQLAYAYVEPLAAPDIWAMLPALLLGRESAVRVTRPFDPAFLVWASRFLMRCRQSALDSALVHLLSLSLESRRALDWLLERQALEFAYRKAGKLILYRDAPALDAAARLLGAKRERGYSLEILDEAAARALEPALADYRAPIAGAVYAPDDAIGDCALFTGALIAAGVARQGLRLHVGCQVTGLLGDRSRVRGVATANGEIAADAVVLAAGLEARALARPLGLKLPIYPVKGYSLTAPAGAQAPAISLTDRAERLLITRLGDKVRVAAFADFDGWHDHPNSARADELTSLARRLYPQAARWDEAEPVWMGSRPMTPDGIPLIGATAIPGLFLNVGHGGLGWTLACGSALRLVRAVSPS